MTNSRQLADELIEGLRQGLPHTLGSDGMGVWSVCVMGSYARGDFIPNNSDLDFHLIFQSGPPDSPYPYVPCPEPGNDAIIHLRDRILGGRKFISHHPFSFDWVTTSWDSLPKHTEEIRIEKEGPMIRLFGIFLFDYLENVQVLWGHDPRKELFPSPPEVRDLALDWFICAKHARETNIANGEEVRLAMTAFNSLLVTQVVFGEQTLDRRRVPDLYLKYVPDFSMKSFGIDMLNAKLHSHYPDHPPDFAPWERYAEFEDQLAKIVEIELKKEQ